MRTAADLFEHVDYRSFLKVHAASRGRAEGREKKSGELKRIATAARVFPSYLSQILAGKRDFTPDQGILVADYLGFGELSRRYFLASIHRERAATVRLRTELTREMDELRQRHLKLSSRLPSQKELSIVNAARFYSSWTFIAIRLYTAIPEARTVPALATRLGLRERVVRRVLDFLVDTGLCVQAKDGTYSYGPLHMHLKDDHPLITKHHANWRARAMEKHALLDPTRELAYSFVAALAKADAQKIRELLPQWIEQTRLISDPSPSETVFCLNLDWFEV